MCMETTLPRSTSDRGRWLQTHLTLSHDCVTVNLLARAESDKSLMIGMNRLLVSSLALETAAVALKAPSLPIMDTLNHAPRRCSADAVDAKLVKLDHPCESH
jgi:hypothetical protein